MEQIEDIFLSSDYTLHHQQPIQTSRIKMGEVFQLPNERYALVCIHCSEEFQYFSEFTLHVQDHFPRMNFDKHISMAVDSIKSEVEIEDSNSKNDESPENLIEQPTEEIITASIKNSMPPEDSMKIDDHHSDDDFEEFFDVCIDRNSDVDINSEEENPSMPTKMKEIALESVVKTRQTKIKTKSKASKSSTKEKRPYRRNIQAATSQSYEELLEKYMSSGNDPMDPVKFELFKAEKVDGLFPCTIKDTPEVRMMASFSLHSYKYEKKGRNYCCPVCASHFPNPASVRRHVFTHIKDRVFLCGFCPQKFRAIRYLRDHLKQKHDDVSQSSFECFMCHKEFNQFRTLKDHVQSHQFGNLHCMLCNKKFKEYRFYQLHMMNIHPNGIDLKSENQANIEPIYYHYQYSERPVITSFECYLCRKDFRERRLLRSHMKLHVQQPRLCLVCGIFCSSATSLSRHMKLHNSDETKSHLCNICGKGFKIRQYLLRHNRKEHNQWADNTPPICQICGAYFDKKSLLHEHMKTHPFEETRNFICSVCGHAARNAYNLKRHAQTHSNGITDFVFSFEMSRSKQQAIE